MDVYMRRRLVAGGVLAAVVLGIIALVASGGDDEPSEQVTEIGATGAGGLAAISTEQLAAQADVICAETETRIDDLDAADNVELIQRQVEIQTEELNQLRALPGEDVDPGYADFLQALQRHLQLLQEQALATERGDDRAVVKLEEQIDEAAADAEDAADAFGLEDCAGAGGGGGGTGESGTEATEETGGTAVAPAAPTAPAPVAPAPTTPAPVAPDTGGGATTTPPAAPPPPPPSDTGGTGGITPG